METTFLTPVLALVSWTLIVWFWMYARRIPAMNAAGLDPQEAQHPGSLNMLPKPARFAADNYNHLHEQPTIFYALIIYSQLAGVADELNLTLAWAYVGLRVLHSLVQITVNKVTLRFTLFAVSTLVLVVIAIRNILAVL
ncbi:conserved protein [Tepidicaulis marinus]|uniref:Conserved protein n=1 Tax=Tepidicaulis marinus TaxID=1333998 RepID=A0A081B7Z3_9HYPH|nr:MAPEG family protein [Tepidicaulis marinus]GAK44161.1 conserved protein [Tepidicaulis marinus]